MMYEFVLRCMAFVTRKAFDQLNQTHEVPIVSLLITEEGDFFMESNDGDKHAEMILLSKYNCRNAMIFVNVEPCPMCLFALSLAKVKYIFFGCYNVQYGACGGKFHLKDHVDYCISKCIGGFFQNENFKIITDYFKRKRLKFNDD